MHDEISRLLATQKVVPFLGAGISRQQLGFAAPGLRNRLAKTMAEPPHQDTDLAAVAQLIEDRIGENNFAAELRKHLQRNEFNDTLATTHLLVLSLDCGVVYTTNQDNLYELACARYKRPHRVVVTIKDIADAGPGERLYIKFHGDPSVPASLVFTTNSYKRRMHGPENFLDIRLRSDLLGKGLLFIGYSMQDENLRELMQQIQRAYHGATPASYLIAYDHQPEMERLTGEFGIRIVNPRALIPDSQSNAEAFERWLQLLCDTTMQHQTRRALGELFTSELPTPVLIEHQLNALEYVAKSEGVASALKAFRSSVDTAFIPDHLQRRVAEVVVVIAEKIVNVEEIRDLKAALFNMFLNPEHALLAMAAFMAACNIRNVTTGFDGSYAIVSSVMHEEFWPIAAANAIEMLLGGGYEISDGFRQFADYWFKDFGGLSDDIRPWVAQQIERGWKGSGRKSPSAQAARLGPNYKPPFHVRRFRDIVNSVEQIFPKRLNLPKRTL